MAKIDRLKEEIGWLKVMFAVLVAIDASLVGWLAQNYAKASGLFEDTDFDPYVTNVSISDRDIDFSGFSATLGVRAYVGY